MIEKSLRKWYIPLFFLSLGVWVIVFIVVENMSSKSPEEKIKHIQYGLTVKNKTSKVVKNVQLIAYAPFTSNGVQACQNIEASRPFQLKNLKTGNQLLYFSINNLPPFGAERIQVTSILTYSFLRDTTLAELDFTGPEPYIESENGKIASLARDLKKGTAFKTASNIYHWVSLNIKKSGYEKKRRGALYALEHRKGDCTELMYLFVALCRSNRIPARGVGGYICKGNCFLIPENYHNWAEFYADGDWQIADCQKKVLVKNSSDYIAMHIFAEDENDPLKGYRRFRVEGPGISATMNH